MTRWLVTGGGGQLGRCLAEVLPERSCVMLRRAELDVTNLEAVRRVFAATRPEVVVNAAAWTDVDGAEQQRSAAHKTNVVGAQNVARAAGEVGARLIHLSTEYVFDGTRRTPYPVGARPVPVNWYGQTKAESEALVLAQTPHAWVVRTSWLFSAYPGNFFHTMANRAVRGEPSRVVSEQRGCPTYAPDLALALFALGSSDCPPGLLHFRNAGVTTWFAFAQAIYDSLRADSELVEPITSKALGRLARRPENGVLDTSAWKRAGLPPPRPWRAALEECATLWSREAGRQAVLPSISIESDGSRAAH